MYFFIQSWAPISLLYDFIVQLFTRQMHYYHLSWTHPYLNRKHITPDITAFTVFFFSSMTPSCTLNNVSYLLVRNDQHFYFSHCFFPPPSNSNLGWWFDMTNGIAVQFERQGSLWKTDFIGKWLLLFIMINVFVTKQHSASSVIILLMNWIF